MHDGMGSAGHASPEAKNPCTYDQRQYLYLHDYVVSCMNLATVTTLLFS